MLVYPKLIFSPNIAISAHHSPLIGGMQVKWPADTSLQRTRCLQATSHSHFLSTCFHSGCYSLLGHAVIRVKWLQAHLLICRYNPIKYDTTFAAHCYHTVIRCNLSFSIWYKCYAERHINVFLQGNWTLGNSMEEERTRKMLNVSNRPH